MTTDMTHTPAEHVAQRIRMYRTRQHMTIDTLARKLHVSPSTISKYENARLALNVSVLFAPKQLFSLRTQLQVC